MSAYQGSSGPGDQLVDGTGSQPGWPQIHITPDASSTNDSVGDLSRGRWLPSAPTAAGFVVGGLLFGFAAYNLSGILDRPSVNGGIKLVTDGLTITNEGPRSDDVLVTTKAGQMFTRCMLPNGSTVDLSTKEAPSPDGRGVSHDFVGPLDNGQQIQCYAPDTTVVINGDFSNTATSGRIDPGEPGTAGTATLVNPDGTTRASVHTNTGKYTFLVSKRTDGMTYTVRFAPDPPS